MKTIKKTFIFTFSMLITLSCFSQTNNAHDYSQKSGIEISKYDEKTIEDIAVLCKTWGFLKFHHPEILRGKYDWDAELFRVMPQILNAKSKKERNKILGQWITGLGDVILSDSILTITPEFVKMAPATDWIEDEKILGKDVCKKLIRIKNAKRDDIEDNKQVSFPWNGSAFFLNENLYPELTTVDTGFRLLGLFRFWNVIEYYFAYKYLIDDDWENILYEFIPQFIDADDSILSFKLCALKLATRIEDSHTRMLNPYKIPKGFEEDKYIEDWLGKYMFPFEISFIEDKPVITDIYSTKIYTEYPFRIGDVIHSVNNEPVERIVERKLEYTPASHYTGKLKKIAMSLHRSNDSIMSITYERNGTILSDTLKAILVSDVDVANRTRRDLPAYRKLHNGISYIYMGATRPYALPEQLDESKGVIIDLRCYPHKITNHWEYYPLFPEPTPFCNFTNVSKLYPGLFHYTGIVKTGKENPDYFKGKKVILINEQAQSAPEFMVMKYKVAPNTIVMGSKTTGADGTYSFIGLPAETGLMFTGVGVYYLDGAETQRVGLLPDIEVKPTIKGIREGRDELLEKAIEYILQD